MFSKPDSSPYDYYKNDEYGECGTIERQFESMCGIHALSNAFGMCIPYKFLPKYEKEYQESVNSDTWNFRKVAGLKMQNDYVDSELNRQRISKIMRMHKLTHDEAKYATGGITNINFLKFIIKKLDPKLGANILTLGSYHYWDLLLFDSSRSIRDYISGDSIYHPKSGWIPFHNIGGIIVMTQYPLIFKILYDVYKKDNKKPHFIQGGFYNFAGFDEMRKWSNNFKRFTTPSSINRHFVAFSKQSNLKDECCWCFKDSTGIVVKNLSAKSVKYIIQKAAFQVLIELPEKPVKITPKLFGLYNPHTTRALRLGAIITLCVGIVFAFRSKEFKKLKDELKKKFTQKKAKSRRKTLKNRK